MRWPLARLAVVVNKINDTHIFYTGVLTSIMKRVIRAPSSSIYFSCDVRDGVLVVRTRLSSREAGKKSACFCLSTFLSSLCLSEEDWRVSEVSSGILVETCGGKGRCVDQKNVMFMSFSLRRRVIFSVRRKTRR